MRAWLGAAERERWLVLTGPQRVVVSDTTWAEPDIAIWPAGQVGQDTGGSSPMLVAEVLSSATARRDRHHKPALYARAGIGWLVIVEPSESATVEVFELDPAGEVRKVASAVGSDQLTCPLTGADLTPAELALG